MQIHNILHIVCTLQIKYCKLQVLLKAKKYRWSVLWQLTLKTYYHLARHNKAQLVLMVMVLVANHTISLLGGSIWDWCQQKQMTSATTVTYIKYPSSTHGRIVNKREFLKIHESCARPCRVRLSELLYVSLSCAWVLECKNDVSN